MRSVTRRATAVAAATDGAAEERKARIARAVRAGGSGGGIGGSNGGEAAAMGLHL